MTNAVIPKVAAPGTGIWLHNAANGELGHFAEIDSDGRRGRFDLWLQPGAAVAREHIHDNFVERFTVRAGEIGFQIAGDARVARPGDPTVEVPLGTPHDWWNAGAGVAHAQVEVVAPPSAPGRPAERFVGMLEAVWSLGTLGVVNAQGVPDLLWLIAIAHEYRDAIRLTKPPAVIQTLLFGPLAALARRTGRDPLAAELHGPSGACAVTDPTEEKLAALLSRSVGTRAARGHG